MAFNYNFISINKKKESHKIAYIDIGKYHSEEVVLCLHGIVRNCRDFDYLTNYLLENNCCRILLVDIVGRGKSDWIVNKNDYTYETYISDILYLMNALNINKVSIIGTSMGGIIAMLIAHKFPMKVKKIVLNDIGPYIKYQSLVDLADRISVYPTFKEIESARVFITKYFSSVGINSSAHIDHILKHQLIFSEKNNVYSFIYDEYITKNLKQDLENNPGKDFNIWESWQKISVPVLIIRGEKSSVLTTETVEQMMIGKNNIDFIEFKNVGHAPSLFEREHILCISEWFKK